MIAESVVLQCRRPAGTGHGIGQAPVSVNRGERAPPAAC